MKQLRERKKVDMSQSLDFYDFYVSKCESINLSLSLSHMELMQIDSGT